MRLKAYLSELDISYKKFADSAGLDPSIVSRAARGEIMPSPDTIEIVKEHTGGNVTADDFHDHVMSR